MFKIILGITVVFVTFLFIEVFWVNSTAQVIRQIPANGVDCRCRTSCQFIPACNPCGPCSCISILEPCNCAPNPCNCAPNSCNCAQNPCTCSPNPCNCAPNPCNCAQNPCNCGSNPCNCAPNLCNCAQNPCNCAANPCNNALSPCNCNCAPNQCNCRPNTCLCGQNPCICGQSPCNQCYPAPCTCNQVRCSQTYCSPQPCQQRPPCSCQCPSTCNCGCQCPVCQRQCQSRICNSPVVNSFTLPPPCQCQDYVYDEVLVPTLQICSAEVACPKPIEDPVPIVNSAIGCLDLVVTEYGTISECPLPKNPCLPTASPVSALSPYLLPPVYACKSRCHFLRKVPIPPPCI